MALHAQGTGPQRLCEWAPVAQDVGARQQPSGFTCLGEMRAPGEAGLSSGH